MKNLLFLLSLSLLISCGSDSGGGGGSCDNSKDAFSVWTSRTNGVVTDFRNGAFNTPITLVSNVSLGCQDALDDTIVKVFESGRIEYYDCSGTFVIAGDWSINCNILNITLDNGNVTFLD